ncbi:DUF5753 domain-containing protein [Streptomyces sp. NPDC002454]
MWRIETGQAGLRAVEVQGMCVVYGASAVETEALVNLARETKEPPWWQGYSSAPEVFDVFMSLEQAASQIDTYESDLVPGLLQTADYTRCIVQAHHPELPDEEVEGRVRLRSERQRIFTQSASPATVRVALAETVVRRPVGNNLSVMAAQIAHLIYVARLPAVILRIVPLEAGVHPGVLSGPFVSMRFPSTVGGVEIEPPTVYTDSFTGGLYLDKAADVERFSVAFEGILGAALDEEETIRLLDEAARRFVP